MPLSLRKRLGKAKHIAWNETTLMFIGIRGQGRAARAKSLFHSQIRASDFGFFEKSRVATALLERDCQEYCREELCLCDGWERCWQCLRYWLE